MSNVFPDIYTSLFLLYFKGLIHRPHVVPNLTQTIKELFENKTEYTNKIC